MFSNLTTGQKVQIGFVLAVFLLSGFLFFRNTRPVPNYAINAWVEVRKFATDRTRPMGRDNLPDPKKEEHVTVFGCYDGKLEICEYPNDPAKGSVIRWGTIDKRRKSYLYYKDPLEPVKGISDPYKHAITLAAYSAANGRKLGLMNGAGLTKEQLDQEDKARRLMMDSLGVTAIQVADGNYRTDLLKPVTEALKAYRNLKGDPLKDTAKADAARVVVERASYYLAMVEEGRSKEIEKYIAVMNKVLTKEQKDIVAKAGSAFNSGGTRMASAGPRAANPNVGGQVGPNRANRSAAPGGQPNRGATTNPANQNRRGSAAPVRNVEAVVG